MLSHASMIIFMFGMSLFDKKITVFCLAASPYFDCLGHPKTLLCFSYIRLLVFSCLGVFLQVQRADHITNVERLAAEELHLSLAGGSPKVSPPRMSYISIFETSTSEAASQAISNTLGYRLLPDTHWDQRL